MAHASQIMVPAQPYLLTLTLEQTALLVIDMQNDFCTPGGWADCKGFDVSQTQQPIKPLQTLLAELRQTPVTIIHPREGHPVVVNGGDDGMLCAYNAADHE